MRFMRTIGRALDTPPDAIKGDLSETEKAKSAAVFGICLTAGIASLTGVQAAVAFIMNHQTFSRLPLWEQVIAASLMAVTPYLLDRSRRLQDGAPSNDTDQSEVDADPGN